MTLYKYKSLENIKRKFTGFGADIIIAMLIPLFLYFIFGGFLSLTTFSVAGIIFFLKMTTEEKIFQGLAKLLVKHKINKAIHVNEKKIKSITQNKESIGIEDKTQPVVYEDKMIQDIKEVIEKVHVAKYEGYQKHLDVLYGIAELYLKTKEMQPNSTPLELFASDERILTYLVAVEDEIEQCINKQQQNIASAKILKELAEVCGYNTVSKENGTTEEIGTSEEQVGQKMSFRKR